MIGKIPNEPQPTPAGPETSAEYLPGFLNDFFRTVSAGVGYAERGQKRIENRTETRKKLLTNTLSALKEAALTGIPVDFSGQGKTAATVKHFSVSTPWTTLVAEAKHCSPVSDLSPLRGVTHQELSPEISLNASQVQQSDAPGLAVLQAALQKAVANMSQQNAGAAGVLLDLLMPRAGKDVAAAVRFLRDFDPDDLSADISEDLSADTENASPGSRGNSGDWLGTTRHPKKAKKRKEEEPVLLLGSASEAFAASPEQASNQSSNQSPKQA